MKSIQAFAKLALLTLVALILSQSPARAATVTASGTVNWSALTGGSGTGGKPNSSDTVSVSSGAILTVDTTATCSALTFVAPASGTNSTVTISGNNTLTVTNAITMARPASGGLAATLNVGAGSVSCGSLTMSATTSTGLRKDVINISTGTLTVSGTLTCGTTGCQITFADTGTWNMGGAFSGGPLSFTASTGTVNYNGAAQTIGAFAYNNLTFSGSGAKSMAAGTSVAGILSIAPTGNATASVGTGLNLSVGRLTLGGVGRVNGTWGSTTATSAANQNNTYFAATTGYLTVSTNTSPTAKDFLTFGPGGLVNTTAATVAWMVPSGTDVTTLAPTFTHTGASVSPASGTQRNFTSPQTYTITAADNSTKTYTVTVTVEPTALPVTSGLVAWLKGSAVNPGDSSQIRSSGGVSYVQKWVDSSGNNYHATNSNTGTSGNASYQPVYVASDANGKPAIQFIEDTGSSGNNGSVLFMGDLSANFPSAASAFIVSTPNDSLTGYTLFDNEGNDGRWWSGPSQYNESTPGTFHGGGRDGTFNVQAVKDAWPRTGTHVFAMESSSSIYRYVVDGSNVGGIVGTPNYDSGSGNTMTVGNRWQGNGTGSQLNGTISELILYNRVLTTSEANLIGNYLATKYAVITSYIPPTPPAAPTGLTATSVAGAVNLSWNASAGATTYSVKRSTSTGGTYTEIGTPSGTTYSDTTAVLGTTYYYVVTAQNISGTSAVSNEASAARLTSSAKAMLTFTFPTYGAATISGTNISMIVPYGTSVTALAPTYTLSAFATGSPVSGTSRNFTTPQTYTVTAEDTSTQTYTVTVTVAPPVPGNIATAPALWLDASQLAGLSDGVTVNTWTDMSATANHAIRQSGSSSGYPKYVASGLNGKPVVRFNSTNGNTGDYFKFTRISTIRTVFWVLRENAGSQQGPFLLGDDTNYDFHRASSNGPLWDSGNANANVRGGVTKLMGTQVDGTSTSLPANSFQLVSLVTSGNVQANQVTQDRTYHGSWQGDIAEIVIYTTALSNADEAAVGSYLAAKYGLATAYPVPPVTPTGLAATPLDGSVSLGWTASTGATGYNVKRSTTSGSGYTQIGTTTSATTYSDSTVSNGTTYYYVVTATNSNGESANSTEASALPVAATVTTTTLATSGTPSIYGGAVTLTTTVTPTPTGGTVQFYDNAVALGSPVTVSGGQAQLVTSTLAVGSHPITATYSGTTGFAGSTAGSMSQSVSQAGQTITFGALAAKTYGDAPFALSATASSGLTVSYVSSDPTVASVTSGSVTILKAGSTTITASQAGDGNYSAATAVPQTLTVNKITPTYKAPSGGSTMVTMVVNARGNSAPASPVSGPAGSAANWNYPNPALTDNGQDANGTNMVDSAGAATGIGYILHMPSNDPWGTPALEMLKTGLYNPGWFDQGICEINGLTSGNTYTLYIASARINSNERSKGTFRTTNAADNQTADVDCSKDPVTGATWSSNSGGPRNGITWVEGNNYVAFRNVIANSNGKILFTANENCAPHLVINGFQLVAAGAPTPPSTPITYGQPLSASTLGGTFTGLGGTQLAGTLAFTSPSTLPNAGSADQGVTFTPQDTTNYNTGSTTVSVTVNKATPVVAATGGSFTADGNPHAGNGTATGGKGEALAVTLSYSGTGSTSYGPTASAPSIAGTYTVTASTVGDTNNNAGSSSAAALTIIAVVTTDTTTIVATSGSPSTYGNEVTFTATIIPTSGSDVPTGAVQFKVDGVNLGSSVAVTTGSSPNGTASISTSALAVSGSPHAVTADFTGTGVFTNSSGTLASGQAVSQQGQTITFGALTAKTYGAAPFGLTATASSSLPVSFASSNETVATVEGSTVTILTAGTTTITASQAGGGNYSAATPVERLLTVNKITPVYKAPSGGAGTTINVAFGGGVPLNYPMDGAASTDGKQSTTPGATAGPLTYTGTTWNELTGSGGTGLKDSGGATTGVSLTFTTGYNGGVGDHGGAGTLNLLGDSLHSDGPTCDGGWSPAPGTVPTFVISGLDNALTYTLAIASDERDGNGTGGFNIGGTLSFPVDQNHPVITGGTTLKNTHSGGTRDTWIEGTTHVKFTGISPVNGSITVRNIADSGRFALNGFQLVAAGAPPTPASTPITYGQPLSASTLGGTFTGLGGTQLAGTLAFTDQATKPDAGTADQSVTFTPQDTTNYNDGTASVSVTVNKATATVVVAPYSVTYNGAPHTATVTSITGVNGETGTSVVGTVTLDTTHTAAGTYPADSWSFAGTANYNNIASTTIIDTIAMANQTITFGALAARTLGVDASFALTATASSGLTVSYASSDESVATVSGSTVTIHKVGSTTITASQAGDGNFNAATEVSQSLTVMSLNEYAFGTTNAGALELNPDGTIKTPGQAPIIQITEDTGHGLVKLVYARRKDSGLAYTVEFSDDLGKANGWLPSDSPDLKYAGSSFEPVVVADGDMEVVSIPFPLFMKKGASYVKMEQSFCRILATTHN